MMVKVRKYICICRVDENVFLFVFEDLITAPLTLTICLILASLWQNSVACSLLAAAGWFSLLILIKFILWFAYGFLQKVNMDSYAKAYVVSFRKLCMVSYRKVRISLKVNGFLQKIYMVSYRKAYVVS